jgi:predicted RNA-binding Zn ribbon-like protein
MAVNRQAGYNTQSMSTVGSLRSQIVVPRRDLAIDFANTVAYRGSTSEESLHSLNDLFSWLTSANALPESSVAALPKLITAAHLDDLQLFNDAITLRETIYRLLRAVATQSAPPIGDLQRLNQALTEAPPRDCLAQVAGSFGWRIELKPAPAAIVASVLWSAADTIARPDSARLRECANDQCLWLFLDDSKNGTRRWCSMQACGNRAKAHRHYQRHKEK